MLFAEPWHTVQICYTLKKKNETSSAFKKKKKKNSRGADLPNIPAEKKREGWIRSSQNKNSPILNIQYILTNSVEDDVS